MHPSEARQILNTGDAIQEILTFAGVLAEPGILETAFANTRQVAPEILDLVRRYLTVVVESELTYKGTFLPRVTEIVVAYTPLFSRVLKYAATEIPDEKTLSPRTLTALTLLYLEREIMDARTEVVVVVAAIEEF